MAKLRGEKPLSFGARERYIKFLVGGPRTHSRGFVYLIHQEASHADALTTEARRYGTITQGEREQSIQDSLTTLVSQNDLNTIAEYMSAITNTFRKYAGQRPDWMNKNGEWTRRNNYGGVVWAADDATEKAAIIGVEYVKLLNLDGKECEVRDESTVSSSYYSNLARESSKEIERRIHCAATVQEAEDVLAFARQCFDEMRQVSASVTMENARPEDIEE